MSRDELIVVVRRQADQITAQDQQITAMAGQLAELMEANEALAAKLARTVIMVTHDVEEAVLLSDRILVMSHGPAARIVDEVAVPFPRPREQVALRTDTEFHALVARLLAQLTAPT